MNGFNVSRGGIHTLNLTTVNGCDSTVTLDLSVYECNVGVEENVSSKISVYPNPANDEVFIKSDSPIEKVELYSLTGALLMQENNFSGKISVSAFPQGVYLLKVYTDKGVAVSKIVKE